MNHTRTGLPVFRLIGLQVVSGNTDFAEDFGRLQRQWQADSSAQALQGFSRSLYLARHDDDGNTCRLTVGRLAAFDAPVPQGLSEHYVPPQQYAVYVLDAVGLSELPPVWEQLCLTTPERRKHTDFAVLSENGAVRLYIGIAGDVAITEEV